MTENSQLHFNADTGFHEARDPALVQALLADPRLGVRPPSQPVPPHLQGRALGEAFGRWLRMRDDAGHAAEKAALIKELAALPSVHKLASGQAQMAFAQGWDHGIWATPVSSMAGLLGRPPQDAAEQQRLVTQMRALARALAPTATAEQLDEADAACAALAPSATELALLWQGFEAGAAQLGQAVIKLAREPQLRRIDALPALLLGLHDQPGVVLNTRRFAREPMQIGETRLALGDGLLLRLDGPLGFGHGAHRCPGRQLALDIAATALAVVIESEPSWPVDWELLKLPNMRIPIFGR